MEVLGLTPLISLQLIATPQGPVLDEPARSFEDDPITIGRAPNCQVVLPDGLRIISRQHVRLYRQGSEVLLGCLSASAPVHVNDVGVPHGGVQPLRSGDVVRIGGFELRVTLQAAAPQPVRGAPAASPAQAAALPAASPAVRPAAHPAALPAALSAVLPPALPPESPVAATPASAVPAALPAQPMAARRGRTRLDEWFDLEPAAAPTPAPAEVVPPGAWAAAELDLDLRSGAQLPASAGAERRIFESLQQVLGPRPEPLPLVRAGDSNAEPVDVAAAPPIEATPAAMPIQAAPVAAVPIQATPVLAARVAETLVAEAPAAAPASAPPLDDEARALLMQAFMEGAGIGPRTGATSTQMLAPMALTPEWMRHIGELLRASVEGSLALLHSRSTVKREMRAEVTVIARRQNNPLKFAPDALAALAHLLAAKRSPGFLEPVAALKDAHEDLLVHHLAVVAGMRAAMFELIARLGPDDVVRDEGPPKGLSSLPTLHEAALWRRYRQRHAEMTARLDDDFETVFGREFTKAYEAQARRVRDKTPPGDTGTGDGSPG